MLYAHALTCQVEKGGGTERPHACRMERVQSMRGAYGFPLSAPPPPS